MLLTPAQITCSAGLPTKDEIILSIILDLPN